MICTYLIGHDFPCTQPATGAHCTHHASMRCVSCHSLATHNCQHLKSNICGQALCDECQHVELPNGANGQFYNHARKGEEPVMPHYGKEAMKGK
ncbi:MAG TPA: hypothetical protein VGB45_06115 [Abditibacterium sp.]|jgi:hypothetical protein